MKKLSEQLSDLSDRAKRTEDVVDAAKAKNRQRLEAQKEALKSAVDSKQTKISQQAANVHADAQSKWQSLHTALGDHVAELRAKAQQREADRDLKHAERRADDADQDAADAIDFALDALDYAEYAIIEAAITRADADDLTNKG